MSRNSLSPLFFVVMMFSIVLNFFVITPAFAQLGGGTAPVTSKPPRTSITYPMPGLPDIRVNASGDLAGSTMNGCPFESGAGAVVDNYQKAFDAAKGKDPNNCPFFLGFRNRPTAYSSCGGFYFKLSKASGAHPNPNFVCCSLKPGIGRQNCLTNFNINKQQINAATNSVLKATGTISKNPELMSPEELKIYQDAAKKEEETEKSCYEDSLKRIGEFWAKKQEVQCFDFAKRMIKGRIKEAISAIKNRSKDQIASMMGATMTSGSSPGAIITVPAPWGTVKIAGTAAEAALQIANVAVEMGALLEDLNKSCGAMLPDLQALQSFRNTLSTNLSCQAWSNLLERQLTQCVRVNLTANFSLPQFSLLLQCPININVSANLGADGFNCFSQVSAGSPISGNFGGRSMISGNGGLENLFNGNCFGNTSNTGAIDGSGDGSGQTGGTSGNTTGAGTRIPGVDCAALDPVSALKQENIQGKVYLNAGTTTSGWAVGATETISDAKGVAVTPPMTVTRCDYYERGRQLRTAYVYGSGASCNSGATGFLDGNYETNTACYSGGYTPAVASAIPDACLYPAGCLDTSGKFSTARKGGDGCPANVLPVFTETNSYNVFTSGGLSGGTIESRSCADFNGKVQSDVVKCCDPQTQDCTKKDVNVPLCQCDEGDASNQIENPTTGACKAGGKATCCSPRMNGGVANCAAMVGNAGICADEMESQCMSSGDPATYTGPDGRPVTLTAADLALAKPSPYVYLFIRPDAKMNNQQCCMTEWCNICPQHYANAYALSLARSPIAQAKSDSENNSLLGKGWPFTTDINELGVTTFNVGVNPFMVSATFNNGMINQTKDVQVNYPLLSMGIDTEVKPLNTAIDACNNISSWKVVYSRDGEFVNGDMGFAYPKNHAKKNEGNVGYAQIKGMSGGTETPLAYLNRIRAATKMGDGTPLAPIQLCSDTVKICYGDEINSSFGTPTGQPTTSSYTAPVTTTPPVTTTTTPSATTTTTTTPAASTTQSETSSSGATVMPSATSGSSGQANSSLY